MRKRWLSRRAFVLHFLLVTVVPGCLLAGWWQVHRALSGNLLSYFYSIEWPIFALLAVIAWWQLVHDQPLKSDYEAPREVRRSWLHRDDEVPSRPLVWDEALESPELKAYNDYLRALSAGRAKKTWRNPRGLPQPGLPQPGLPHPGEPQPGELQPVESQLGVFSPGELLDGDLVHLGGPEVGPAFRTGGTGPAH